MSFEWFIARRYLTARRRQAFISLISGVSMLGVTVGVMAVIVALALMTGVQRELRDRIVGSTAHIYVYKTGNYGDDLEEEIKPLMVPGVIGAAPAVVGKGLIESSAADTQPVEIKGIDPAREPQVTEIQSAMQSGSVNALANRSPDDQDGVILGAELARFLRASVGDTVYLSTTQFVIGPGFAAPKQRALQVVGIAKFGFYQTDSLNIFVTIETAKQMLGRDGPDLVQLKIEQVDQAPRCATRCRRSLGSATRWTTGPSSTPRCIRRCGWRRWPFRSRSGSSSWWPRSTSWRRWSSS